jgi:hypothetical protein
MYTKNKNRIKIKIKWDKKKIEEWNRKIRKRKKGK